MVESPCIRNCCLDDRDICLGCFRALPEIADWSKATELEKRQILDRCRQRKENATQ